MTPLQIGLLFVLASPFGVAVWIASRTRRPRPAGSSRGEMAPGAPAEVMEVVAPRPGFKAEMLDLEAEVAAIVGSLADEAREPGVSLQFAVNPSSLVRVDWNALWVALRAVVKAAIQATPGGHVLVTAKPVDEEMLILVMDDGTAADQRTRESLVREAMTLIALQGGATVVEAKRGRGTTVTIRLPLPRAATPEWETDMAEVTLAREVA